MKNYFVKSELMKYLILINLLLLVFGKLVFFLGCIISIWIVYSYRKIRLSSYSNKDIEFNSVFSPVSGKVSKIKTEGNVIKVTIRTSLLGPLGVFMPFSGTVDKVKDQEIKLFNKLGQPLSLSFRAGVLRDSRSWLKTGDLGTYSANIGFLGIGGSIDIKTESNIKILVEKGQRVFAGQSIIAGFEVNDER